MAVVARGQITIVDLSDPIISSTAPPEAVEDMLWLDISKTPPVLKVYKNGKWQAVGDSGKLEEALKEMKELYDNVVGELEQLNKEMNEIGTLPLLEIDNKVDKLWEYSSHLTSTSDDAPVGEYVAQLKKNEGVFNSAVAIPKENGKLKYNHGNLVASKDITINLWIKPMQSDLTIDKPIIQLGDSISTSFVSLVNYSPCIANANNVRLAAEMGTINTTRHRKELISPTLFNTTKWEMLTITYNATSRRFTFYRNGENWGTYDMPSTLPIQSINLIQSGWLYDNVAILQKEITATQILTIYKNNKPFRDPNKMTPQASNPTPLDFTIDGQTIRTQGTILSNVKYTEI